MNMWMDCLTVKNELLEAPETSISDSGIETYTMSSITVQINQILLVT